MLMGLGQPRQADQSFPQCESVNLLCLQASYGRGAAHRGLLYVCVCVYSLVMWEARSLLLTDAHFGSMYVHSK